MDHISWFGAEWKALLCGLSWQIFRLDWQVVFLLARFSVSLKSTPRFSISYALGLQRAKQAAITRQHSDTTVVFNHAGALPAAVESPESVHSTLATSEDGMWPDDTTRKDSWYVASYYDWV